MGDKKKAKKFFKNMFQGMSAPMPFVPPMWGWPSDRDGREQWDDFRSDMETYWDQFREMQKSYRKATKEQSVHGNGRHIH